MKLAILLTKGHRLLSVAAMLDVFETANQFYIEDGKPARFTIHLLHQEGHFVPYEGYEPKQPTDGEVYDIVMIPALRHDYFDENVRENSAWGPWLRAQYSQGAAVAGYCTGAFVLAVSGLLNGRPATTHINAGGGFAKLFPDVVLHEEAVVTEKDRVFTSGGATNSFHLMLRLLEIYCGRPFAVRVAKVFSIDMDRSRQLYFGTFMPDEAHGDELVKQAQEQIKRNFSKAATIEEILAGVPASRRNLLRRFKQVTGVTPIEYLQKTRIEAAKQLLEESRASITEIMYDSGYNDLKTFRTLFKKNVGMTPKSYREKFAIPVMQTA